MSDLPIRQIDEYVWEIPKHGGMRVPGRVYASAELMKDIRKDASLQQVANVAHLPGIVGYSLAMPDIHLGYGFPIGGVAAVDAEEGAITPGGIGFDVNCLSGDTTVLHRFGYHRPIGEIVRERLTDSVRCYDLAALAPDAAPIARVMSRRPSQWSVFELTTVGGRTIRATSDHPFLTPDGMRVLGDLSPGDHVAVEPFVGVPYEDPGDEILIDEADVRQFLASRAKLGGNTAGQVLRV